MKIHLCHLLRILVLITLCKSDSFLYIFLFFTNNITFRRSFILLLKRSTALSASMQPSERKIPMQTNSHKKDGLYAVLGCTSPHHLYLTVISLFRFEYYLFVNFYGIWINHFRSKEKRSGDRF